MSTTERPQYTINFPSDDEVTKDCLASPGSDQTESGCVVGLDELAHHANELHLAVQNACRNVVTSARECGQVLLQAREQCSHGSWLAWLAANFSGSGRTAAHYMKVARCWTQIEANSQRVADLTMRQALRLVSRPRRAPGYGDRTLRTMLPAARQELCLRWWDIRASRCLYYAAMDWSEARLAEFLGATEDVVRAILSPQPPIRFDTPENGQGLLPPPLEHFYREFVSRQIHFQLAWACHCAASLAEDQGNTELATRLKADHKARREAAGDGPTWPGAEGIEESSIYALFECALEDVALALHNHPNPLTDLLELWAEAALKGETDLKRLLRTAAKYGARWAPRLTASPSMDGPRLSEPF